SLLLIAAVLTGCQPQTDAGHLGASVYPEAADEPVERQLIFALNAIRGDCEFVAMDVSYQMEMLAINGAPEQRIEEEREKLSDCKVKGREEGKQAYRLALQQAP